MTGFISCPRPRSTNAQILIQCSKKYFQTAKIFYWKMVGKPGLFLRHTLALQNVQKKSLCKNFSLLSCNIHCLLLPMHFTSLVTQKFFTDFSSIISSYLHWKERSAKQDSKSLQNLFMNLSIKGDGQVIVIYQVLNSFQISIQFWLLVLDLFISNASATDCFSWEEARTLKLLN